MQRNSYLNKDQIMHLITESLNEFERCPIGYQIYLRMTFYSNGAILSQIIYNDELISSINEEDITDATMLDYFEYNRDYGIPDVHEISKMYGAYNLTV